MVRRPGERTRLRRGLRPGSYKVTARRSRHRVGHLEIGSTDHSEGIQASHPKGQTRAEMARTHHRSLTWWVWPSQSTGQLIRTSSGPLSCTSISSATYHGGTLLHAISSPGDDRLWAAAYRTTAAGSTSPPRSPIISASSAARAVSRHQPRPLRPPCASVTCEDELSSFAASLDGVGASWLGMISSLVMHNQMAVQAFSSSVSNWSVRHLYISVLSLLWHPTAVPEADDSVEAHSRFQRAVGAASGCCVGYDVFRPSGKPFMNGEPVIPQ